MPMDLSRDDDEAFVAIDAAAARSAWEEEEEVSQHKGEEDEKARAGAKEASRFIASVPAASVHPIEDTTDNDDLPSFHINRLLRRHPIQGAAAGANQVVVVAADTNGDLSKQNSNNKLGLMELQNLGVDEQGAAAAINPMTAPKEEEADEERQELQCDDLKKLPDEDVVPSYTGLASDEFAGGELGVFSIPKEPDAPFEEKLNSEPTRDLDASAAAAPGNLDVLSELADKNSQRLPLQDDDNGEHTTHNGITYPEKDELGVTKLAMVKEGNSRCLQGKTDGNIEETSHVEEPPTTFDIFHGPPAEASNNATEEATEVPAGAAAAFNVELSEAPRAVSVSGNSQEVVDMPATSRESAEDETVAPFAHYLMATSSGEKETSHVHAEQEATTVPPPALSGELSEAPKGVMVSANSLEEVEMPAPSRESAEDETVAPFAHNLMSSSSGKTEASNVHVAEEATEVAATPISTTGEMRDLSLPQEHEENLPNNHDKFIADGKQGGLVDSSKFPGDLYYTVQTGDPLNMVDPPDNPGRSSQGHDSPGTKTHSGSRGGSSRSHEKSVSDVDAYADLAPIPYSGPIAYSGPISAAYSGPISYSGAPNHSGPFPFSGSISHRSDSSAASNRSFAFPIFSTDWNSSPVRMAQPDRRYLRHKRRWRPSCMCCSRPSPTYY
ncbi:unnamed protein product [Sphagnum jensenii]|uniref:Uncharacterized protein n=1 Tax=Sphagnum jensenii TaxID=128206 RepID=A0ABP1AMN0_9BRYO